MAASAPAFALVVASALGYAGATVVMSRMGTGYGSALTVAVGVALLLAVLAEIAALRHLTIVTVYLGILSLETLFVLAVAVLLGQGLGLRELLGAALVVAGTVLIAGARG